MVNQVLCHISNTPLSLLSFCRSRGILLEAYSPVAHGEAKKNPAIQRMAQRYGVSVPQLCIRYDLQLGMVVLPKAANPEHMRENASLDFTISEEDMDQLLRLPPIQDYGPFRHFPVFGAKRTHKAYLLCRQAVRFPCAFPKNHLSPERELWYTTVVFLSFDSPSHERSLFWT